MGVYEMLLHPHEQRLERLPGSLKKQKKYRLKKIFILLFPTMPDKTRIQLCVSVSTETPGDVTTRSVRPEGVRRRSTRIVS